MKQIKIVPILIVICVLIAGVVVYTLAASLTGGYNPDRYIELGQYENLTVTVTVSDPTDDEIETAMDAVLAQLGNEIAVTDGAKTGDTVTFDYVGKINGKQEDNLTGEETSLTLGQDTFIVSGMDEALLGANAGDTVTTSLTVQENYYYSDYVGKTVNFTVMITSVTRSVTPELTDELAKQLGDYDTAEEFKTAFREQYILQRQQENDATVRSQLWNTVVDNTEVKGYPSEELETLKTQFRAEVQAGADEYEMEFMDYASFIYGVSSEEEFDEYSTEYNQGILKQQMILKSICKKEKVSLSDEEYAQYVSSYLELLAEQNYTEEDLIELYGGEESLQEQFLLEKVTDLIEETATVTKQ